MKIFNDERVQRWYDTLITLRSHIDSTIESLESYHDDISYYEIEDLKMDSLFQLGELLRELEE